jgi:hypothetical protein
MNKISYKIFSPTECNKYWSLMFVIHIYTLQTADSEEYAYDICDSENLMRLLVLYSTDCPVVVDIHTNEQ